MPNQPLALVGRAQDAINLVVKIALLKFDAVLFDCDGVLQGPHPQRPQAAALQTRTRSVPDDLRQARAGDPIQCTHINKPIRQSETNLSGNAELLVALYGTMVRIRAFEDAAEIASQGGVSAYGKAVKHEAALIEEKTGRFQTDEWLHEFRGRRT